MFTIIICSILLLIGIIGFLAAKSCKSRYKALCLHYYGTANPYADAELIKPYIHEQELQVLAAYRQSKSSVAVYADDRQVKPSIVRIVFCFLFSIFVIVGFAIYPVVLSPFSRPYVAMLKVGEYYRVYDIESILGKPDDTENEGNTMYYFGRNYRKAYKEMKEIEEEYAAALFSGDLSKAESVRLKGESLQTKIQNMKFSYLKVSLVQSEEIHHYGAMLSSVVLDKNYVPSAVFAQKTVKSIKLIGESSFLRGTVPSGIYAQCYYTDGSYKCAPVPASAFLSFDRFASGYQTLKWEDDWGTYSLRILMKDEVSLMSNGLQYTCKFNNITQSVSMEVSGTGSYYMGNEVFSTYASSIHQIKFGGSLSLERSSSSSFREKYPTLRSVVLGSSVQNVDARYFEGLEVWCESTMAQSSWSYFSLESWGEYENAPIIHWVDTWEYVNGVPTLK